MTPAAIRFGDYRLLPQARELWRGPVQVALPPRAFDCLVYLVMHRERAVGRDELISAVWGRGDISDTLVAQTVLRIRRTLDNGDLSREWIRTVPRFGYRWVAAVSDGPAPAIDRTSSPPPADPAPDQPVRQSPRQGRRRNPWPWLAALALTVVGVVVLVRHDDAVKPRATHRADHTKPATWLVLPVAGEGHAAPEWIRLGAMDAIAEQLRRAGLVVLPSDQALTLATEFAVPGQPPDIGNLRQASGSRYVVQPHSARIDQRWRLTLTMHDPTAAPVLYRGVDADLLAAARQAGNALLASQGLVDQPLDGGGARDQLLAHAEAALLAGRLREAEALLVERRPELADDALALLKLAQVRYRLGDMVEALASIHAVLARDDIDDDTRSLALVRSGNAHIRSGSLPEAERAFEQALALLAGAGSRELQGEAWNGLGVVQQMQGRMGDAGGSLARAAALHQHGGDPLAYARTLINLGLHAMESGRPHEAIDRFLLAEPITLRFGGADEQSALQQSIGWTRLFLAQPAAAREPTERALTLAAGTESPRVRRQALGLAVRVAVANGELARADALIRQYAASASDSSVSLQTVYEALVAQARQDWPRVRDLASSALGGLGHSERESHGLAAELALMAALALDDRDTEARALAVFAQLAAADPDGRWAIRARLARARRDMAHEGAAAVVEPLRATWTDADRMRLAPVDQLEVGLGLLDALIADSEVDQAQQLLDQLAPRVEGDYRLALAEAAIARRQRDQPRSQAALARARQLAGERTLPTWAQSP